MIKNLWLGLLLGLAWVVPVWAADKKDNGGVYETKGDPKVVSGGIIYGGIVDIVIGDVTIAARRRDIRELAIFRNYLDVNKEAERILVDRNLATAFDPRFVDHLIMLLQSFSKLPDYSDTWDEQIAPLKAYLNSEAAKNLLLKEVAGPVDKVIDGADTEIINKFANLRGHVFDEEQIEVVADDYVKELRREPAFLADPVFIAKCRQDFIDKFTERLKFALTAVSSSVHDFNQYSLDELRDLFLIATHLKLDKSIRKKIEGAFFAKVELEYEKIESLIRDVSLSDNQKRLIKGIKYKWLENGPLVGVTPEEKYDLPVEVLHILEEQGFLAKGIVLKILQSQVALEDEDGDLGVDFDKHDDVD